MHNDVVFGCLDSKKGSLMRKMLLTSFLSGVCVVCVACGERTGDELPTSDSSSADSTLGELKVLACSTDIQRVQGDLGVSAEAAGRAFVPKADGVTVEYSTSTQVTLLMEQGDRTLYRLLVNKESGGWRVITREACERTAD